MGFQFAQGASASDDKAVYRFGGFPGILCCEVNQAVDVAFALGPLLPDGNLYPLWRHEPELDAYLPEPGTWMQALVLHGSVELRALEAEVL